MTDPIADMLTRIRNAGRVHKATTDIPYSKMKHAIAEILVREGYLESVEKVDEGFGILRVVLRYNADGSTPYTRIRRVSTPGHRVYARANRLPQVLGDFGIAVVSTSRGIMTNKDARKKKLGGEVLCEIY